MRIGPQGITASLRRASTVPNAVHHQLRTAQGWSHAEPQRLKTVAKGWKRTLTTSPGEFDAPSLPAAPRAPSRDLTEKTIPHPIFSRVENLLVYDFDEITIKDGPDSSVLLRDLPSVLEEQAFSPPATRAEMFSDEDDHLYFRYEEELTSVPENLGGLTVRDVFEFEMQRMAQEPEVSQCGYPHCCIDHEAGPLAEIFWEEGREFKGYSVSEGRGYSVSEGWGEYKYYLLHKWEYHETSRGQRPEEPETEEES